MEPNTTNQSGVDEETNRMFENIEGEIKTRFELLPTELQQVITSSDYQMKLFEVAKKHKLTYEKLGQLELETTMVILGMTPPDEFKLDISEQLGLKGSELDSVVLDINEAVFKPIREKLISIYSEKEVTDAENYAKEVTNNNAVTSTNSKIGPSSIYKETIPEAKSVSPEKTPEVKSQALNLSGFDAKPGIVSGGIPTSEKNIADAKKEHADTSIKSDPYRELPGEIKNEKPAPLTKEFLSGLPNLTNKEEIVPKTIAIVDQVKNEGGIKTMASGIEKAKEEGNKTPAPSSTNSLKNISNLKSILSQKISLTPKKMLVEEKASPVVEKIAPTVEKATFVAPTVLKTEPPTLNKIDAPEITNTPGGLNLSALSKITSEIKKPVEAVQNVVSREKVEVPKQAVNLMTDLKKDIEDLNKKIQAPEIPSIQSVAKSLENASAKPIINTLGDIKITQAMPQTTPNKPSAIFDDGVKFMDEKVAKPGFFSKIKSLFAPKKPVDVLVTPKINTGETQKPVAEKVTTMKSMMDSIKK